ncbi:hypothetical protein [Thermosulfurimonas sp. F29]|uniref:hypothetical protein n=1 Tax=Thermosulfurimonas sp. F29 TaxID=2867247 RepID=UPI001C83CBDE|nr:hypothetical protein [Thermosulfurimonas sp. F29]MBX6424185.1 hypothetical protein [Thermosulfurimonas sp. F29]
MEHLIERWTHRSKLASGVCDLCGCWSDALCFVPGKKIFSDAFLSFWEIPKAHADADYAVCPACLQAHALKKAVNPLQFPAEGLPEAVLAGADPAVRGRRNELFVRFTFYDNQGKTPFLLAVLSDGLVWMGKVGFSFRGASGESLRGPEGFYLPVVVQENAATRFEEAVRCFPWREVFAGKMPFLRMQLRVCRGLLGRMVRPGEPVSIAEACKVTNVMHRLPRSVWGPYLRIVGHNECEYVVSDPGIFVGVEGVALGG